ncbi:hypothetical protein QBC45DRAFT_456636 [Copromyces sp. CBS 386.78]|nr:hypothetical protein QBC45DRAFT_456636 [Copromyces sp. CBS 386.78]
MNMRDLTLLTIFPQLTTWACWVKRLYAISELRLRDNLAKVSQQSTAVVTRRWPGFEYNAVKERLSDEEHDISLNHLPRELAQVSLVVAQGSLFTQRLTDLCCRISPLPFANPLTT